MASPPSEDDGGSHNNWVTIKLIGDGKTATPFGARVKVVSGELTQWDEVHAGGGYLSADDPRLHYGCKKDESRLGRSSLAGWKARNVGNVPANNFLVIEEGKGLTRAAPPSVKNSVESRFPTNPRSFSAGNSRMRPMNRRTLSARLSQPHWPPRDIWAADSGYKIDRIGLQPTPFATP